MEAQPPLSSVWSLTGARSGLYAAYDNRTVTKRIVTPKSRIRPNTEVGHGPLSGLRQKPGRVGPGGGPAAMAAAQAAGSRSSGVVRRRRNWVARACCSCRGLCVHLVP